MYCAVSYDVCGHVLLKALIRVLKVLSQHDGLVKQGLHEAILPEGEPMHLFLVTIDLSEAKLVKLYTVDSD